MFRSLFDPNSAFFRGMERVWTLVVLNVLWVLCSLPVVTIGPSTAALYQVLGKVIQGRTATRRENFSPHGGELQVCPAGMAAHAGGAGPVRL
ncbi:MAG: YesL family protein [Oscillospiraceae bacterium]